MNDFLDTILAGNRVMNWLIAISIMAISFLLLRVFKNVSTARLKLWVTTTKSRFDDVIIVTLEKNIFPFLYFLAIYGGLSYLAFGKKAIQVINIAILTIGTFFVIRTITSFINFAILRFVASKSENADKRKQVRGITLIVSMIIWMLGVLFLVDNLGYDITTVIAGLGIGGIAIALAAQTVLGDLFSYFVIFFDKPFEIGDFITIDDKMGTVEYVGIKTTRIRTLSGEQLVCSNTDLTNSWVHNYKKMEKRRIVFSVGVVYDNSTKKIKQLPEIIKEVIENLPDTQFDRAHFSSFGDFSLNFECVYYVLSGDYNLYMDKQQAINLQLLEIFRREKIDFAYPTQTLLLQPGATPKEMKNYSLQS
jgi:small-conductance mechanosensitive channel